MKINHIPGPEGVRGRNSDNTLIRQVLGWAPPANLREGLRKTFDWISQEVAKYAYFSFFRLALAAGTTISYAREEAEGVDSVRYAISNVVRDRTPDQPVEAGNK